MSKFKITLFVILILLLALGWYVSTGHFSEGERAGTALFAVTVRSTVGFGDTWFRDCKSDFADITRLPFR